MPAKEGKAMRWSAARRLATCRAGSAAVEFAIISSFLALAFMGVYDFGMASWHRMRVVAAAHAGGAYADAHGFNSNGIIGAVTAMSESGTIAAVPAPAQVCACPLGSEGATEVSCGSTCADGSTAGIYVRVSARASYTFVLPYPGVTSPKVLTAQSFTRIQ